MLKKTDKSLIKFFGQRWKKGQYKPPAKGHDNQGIVKESDFNSK